MLYPRRVRELCEELGGDVRACFVGLAEADTPAKLQEIRRFGGGTDDWLRHYSDEQLTQEIERLKALSVRLQRACRECGIVYFETADNLSSTVTRVIRYLSKGNVPSQ